MDRQLYDLLNNKNTDDKMLDVIIRNGWLVDGTGNPKYRSDVGIKGDRIVEVGKLGKAQAILDRPDDARDKQQNETGKYNQAVEYCRSKIPPKTVARIEQCTHCWPDFVAKAQGYLYKAYCYDDIDYPADHKQADTQSGGNRPGQR